MLARLLRRILFNQMRIMYALNVLMSQARGSGSSDALKASQFLAEAMESSQADYEDTKP